MTVKEGLRDCIRYEGSFTFSHFQRSTGQGAFKKARTTVYAALSRLYREVSKKRLCYL